MLLKLSVAGGPYQVAATVVAMQPSHNAQYVCSYCMSSVYLGDLIAERISARH